MKTGAGGLSTTYYLGLNLPIWAMGRILSQFRGLEKSKGAVCEIVQEMVHTPSHTDKFVMVVILFLVLMLVSTRHTQEF